MNNSENVSVRGTLSFEDIKEFQIHHLKFLGIIAFITIFVLFTPLLFIAMRIIFLDILRVNLLFIQVVLALILSLIAATLMYFWFRLVIRFRSTSEYKSDQQIRSEVIYTFCDDGINQKRSNSNIYYEWDDVISIYEHQNMYLLYVSKFKAIILPKRFFETEDQKELFKQVVCKNITTQKTKWL
ncbi:YcxB-like protein [Lentibacillus persicus]|uniref:YcxB-like protein n=1 Tax=Lentibacillus persicus TaxID=640948 RepID=A0A1I1Z8R1_9BACI|nr:YcxB family protein [Lentibacillus persicus]SFE28075.1 YcxB-like protein [Lentibacillus persicus]